MGVLNSNFLPIQPPDNSTTLLYILFVPSVLGWCQRGEDEGRACISGMEK